MAGSYGFGSGMGSGMGGGMSSRMSKHEQITGKVYNPKVIKRLAKYAVPYWPRFVFALLLILSISASSLARPYLMKMAIDDYMMIGSKGLISLTAAESGVIRLSLIFLSLILIEFVFGYLQTYLLQSTGKKIIMNLRDKVFRQIQRLPVAYFDKNPVGRIMTRVTNDTDALNEMYTDVVVSFLQDVFVMGIVIFIMIGMSPKLTLVSMLIVPVMVFTTIFYRRRARRIFNEIRTKIALINAFLSEHISGMRIIQAFNMQEKKYKEFEQINQEYCKANFQQIYAFGFFRPFMEVINSFSLALLLWYGGGSALRGIVEIGTLSAFITYTNRFFQPITDLAEKYSTMQSSLVASDRIFSILDEKLEPEPVSAVIQQDNVSGSFQFDKVKGSIQFKNVWFAYNNEDWVLKDVTFDIRPGESAAFVGATGAGKTSIINLICGFYEIQKGEILIDGINIREIAKNKLRRNIGLVLQDVFLFSGDIESNIRMFDASIPEESVKQAAEYVNADYFIKRMPEGYKSAVNEKGSTLSAGQRQLLSFARALICNPAILVMDEATSNIDTETECLIQDALGKLMKDRTTIAIAHRLSTVQKADKIIVIHKGQVREIGSHQELLAQEGLYFNLFKLQYRDFDQMNTEAV